MYIYIYKYIYIYIYICIYIYLGDYQALFPYKTLLIFKHRYKYARIEIALIYESSFNIYAGKCELQNCVLPFWGFPLEVLHLLPDHQYVILYGFLGPNNLKNEEEYCA